MLSEVNERSPLVHCITNPVTINDCANALLAIGASPIMSTNPLETGEVTSHADALVINLGHITTIEAVLSSAAAAKEKGIPIVIDPVGVGVSEYRQRMFLSIIDTAAPALIRGNASEIRTLLTLIKGLHQGNDEKGVDVSAGDRVSAENLDHWIRTAADLAESLSCTVVLSGPIDIITDGENVSTDAGGSVLMRRITGAGCMLSSICGAALASYPDAFTGAKEAVNAMNTAAAEAEKRTSAENGGPGTFHIRLIDGLGNSPALFSAGPG